jgi:nitrogen fixation/metabolism regulation signal transduction histidine kinase
MEQVDAARDNLQTILDNLTAGVVVLDEPGPPAQRQPRRGAHPAHAAGAHLGQRLARCPAWRPSAPGCSSSSTASCPTRPHEGGHWQQSFELNGSTAAASKGHHPDRARRLLPNNDRLLVFDDVSEVVSAQRAQAWGEVARRLAHEIKNPLTPIQLSAERLAMKLEARCSPPNRRCSTSRCAPSSTRSTP